VNKIERVKAALRCESVDQPPYSFWTHLPGIDLDPQRLAYESAAFATRYDIDFVKSQGPHGIDADIRWSVAETQARGLLLAPACVIRHPVDDATLLWTAQRIKGLAET
jgi:hypothetical protein